MARKAMTLQEQKQVMLDILTVFADFCDENGLMYFLDAGTLIGAVRHKGFIPWDDDIDVCMPMKDYDRFVALTKENNGILKDYLCVEYPQDTTYPFLKISDNRTVLIEFPERYPMEVGVYMDVFPKYGIKDKGFWSKRVCNFSEFLWLVHWFNKYIIKEWQQPSFGLFKRYVACFIEKITWNDGWAASLQNKFMHNYAKKHPLDKCRYVTTLTNGEFHKLAPKECFSDYQYLSFEGKSFKAPIDYDNYLHCLYKGDYMQLPPVEKRYHHETKVYWK